MSQIKILNYMIDGETNALNVHEASFTSFAAVPFNPSSGNILTEPTLHCKIDGIPSVDDATSEWRYQNGVDQTENFIKLRFNQESFEQSICELFCAENVRVILWAKPTKFDVTILERMFPNGVAWHYRDIVDVASYCKGALRIDNAETFDKVWKSMHEISTKMVEERGGSAHCALSDCLIQMNLIRMANLPINQFWKLLDGLHPLHIPEIVTRREQELLKSSYIDTRVM